MVLLTHAVPTKLMLASENANNILLTALLIALLILCNGKLS
jgi:hypothetical protein